MAQVSWNRQLGLAAALFALGTAAYWLEYKHKPEKESSEEQSKKIFQLKDTPVEAIKLIGEGKQTTFQCLDLASKLCKPGDHSKWEITEPMKLKADDSNVNALLSTLNTLNSTETIDLKQETPQKRAALIKEYGLDAESRKNGKSVEVNASTGKTTLVLGLPHPIGESIFALKNSDENQVYLIPSFFKANLERDLTYWRDKKLLTLSAHEIDSFHLSGSKAKIKAERKEGQWIIQSGSEEFAGDPEAIDSVLSAAAYLSAKGFAPSKSVLTGFAPTLTLTLQKEKGTAKEASAPITVTFFQKKGLSAPGGKLYATVSNLDPVFEVDVNSKDRFDKSLKDLRLAKLITSMDRFSAKRLEFGGSLFGESPLILVNSNGKWIKASDKTEVPAEKVSTVLDKISGNRIQEFLVGSAVPAGEKEGLKVTLGDEKTEARRQLIFWRKEGKLYAKDLQSKRNEVYLVDPSVTDALPWSPDFFAKTESKPDAKSGNGKK
jgi:hypothetical protein